MNESRGINEKVEEERKEGRRKGSRKGIKLGRKEEMKERKETVNKGKNIKEAKKGSVNGVEKEGGKRCQ